MFQRAPYRAPQNPLRRTYGRGPASLYPRVAYAIGYALGAVWKGLTKPFRKERFDSNV